MESCVVNGCDGRVYVKSKGLCTKHYSRLRKTGTTSDGPKARGSLAERFWRQVDVRGDDECWPWTAKSKVDGYGVIGLGGKCGKKVLAHRLSWQLHNGNIPESDGYHGTVVMHLCDNPVCVNPKHLSLGTQSDNVKDMCKKGRKVSRPPAGEDHKNSKLTEKIVREILVSKESGAQIAKRLGLSRSTINRVRSRETWKHIT